MRPITEQNAAPQKHPGAEVDVGPSDAATVRAIKGKGLVATLPSHFVVAVIVGLAAHFWTQKPDPVSEQVGGEARRCNESVTQLRADFTQFKAEQALHNLAQEQLLNGLTSRIGSIGLGQPSPAPSQLSVDVSRQLGR